MAKTIKRGKVYLLILSLLSGSILALGWPERGFPGLLFIGLVPMLVIEEHIRRYPDKYNRFSILFYSYPGFLLWNVLTTWWIVNSTLTGGILANVLNALFMSVVMQLYHWARVHVKSSAGGYAALVSYWIGFEYLHLTWDLNWPWLNLGNGFATWYTWVQWYEYTGAMGGTLWVLIANILFHELLHRRTYRITLSALTAAWVITPVVISLIIYNTYREVEKPVDCIVVQPNIDPYSEQYDLPPSQVIGRIMALAVTKLDSNVSFLVAPESAIQERMWENDLSSFESLKLLKGTISQYPNLNMLVGGSTFYQLYPDEPLPRWARKFTDTDNHYVAYNSAIMINNRDPYQIYHKSKLTPGVEILPSFKGFSWLEKYAIDLGGTVGSLGMDTERKVYTTVGSVPVGPCICYESIFGEFFARFVQNGAQVMMIITNDGWWGNTAGHRQHYAFAHLRAIETRRSIARSANTGISAFIDQRGDAHQQTAYWTPAVIRGKINANNKITFYVRYGDYIAVFASWAAGFFFMLSLGLSLTSKYNRIKNRIRSN